MSEHAIAEGVFQLTAPKTRWLSTGWDGGYRLADAAYNVSVPAGWDHENLAEYVPRRRERAGFESPGPTLLTGVDLEHARGARLDPVVVYATAGVSNPATLPADGEESDGEGADANEADSEGAAGEGAAGEPPTDGPSHPGTVNLLVRATCPLTDGALATLVATAVEAKTATLLDLSGFTGTTTDAVIAGAPAITGTNGTAAAGDTATGRRQWAGSGTAVGNATRVCVRDAVRASFASRYDGTALPGSVAEADHGVVTEGTAEVFEP